MDNYMLIYVSQWQAGITFPLVHVQKQMIILSSHTKEINCFTLKKEGRIGDK